ncbi:MAG TPA: hypothetical protein VFA66_07245 [Gaiellaceae bacterium]|nr:hypothetical protein [Gaiellaceae bacterium]
MKPTFWKGLLLGCLCSGIVVVASAALAGTTVGGVFNIGVSNGPIAAQTSLTNTAASSTLFLSNTSTEGGGYGLYAKSASTAGAIRGSAVGSGPGGLFTSSTGMGVRASGSTYGIYASAPTTGQAGHFLGSAEVTGNLLGDGGATLNSPDGRFSIQIDNTGIVLSGPGGTVKLGTDIQINGTSTVKVGSAGKVQLTGSQITLNGCNGDVARVGDTVVGPDGGAVITTGSPTVCAG